MNVASWICQVLLGAVFAWSGAHKSVQSKRRMIETGQTGVQAYSLPFIRFVAEAELLSVLGSWRRRAIPRGAPRSRTAERRPAPARPGARSRTAQRITAPARRARRTTPAPARHYPRRGPPRRPPARRRALQLRRPPRPALPRNRPARIPPRTALRPRRPHHGRQPHTALPRAQRAGCRGRLRAGVHAGKETRGDKQVTTVVHGRGPHAVALGELAAEASLAFEPDRRGAPPTLRRPCPTEHPPWFKLAGGAFARLASV